MTPSRVRSATIAFVAVEVLVLICGVLVATACKPLASLNISMRRAFFRQPNLDEDDKQFVAVVFAIAGVVLAAVAAYFLLAG
jgi:putative exporter of polyketide antibiotics